MSPHTQSPPRALGRRGGGGGVSLYVSGGGGCYLSPPNNELLPWHWREHIHICVYAREGGRYLPPPNELLPWRKYTYVGGGCYLPPPDYELLVGVYVCVWLAGILCKICRILIMTVLED